MIAELPQNVIWASTEIVELTEAELQCDLNPNLPFTLADHLNFAILRVKSGMTVPTPLSYDVKHLYPSETRLGFQALDILEKYAQIRLPDCEAYSIALHLINAETGTGSMSSMMRTLDVISEMEKIVESHYGVPLDQESYSYSRFMLHLQYLVQRLKAGKQVEERSSRSAVFEIARQYPDAYVCANRVCDHLDKQYGWKCNSEEILYLMLHIQRVASNSQT